MALLFLVNSNITQKPVVVKPWRFVSVLCFRSNIMGNIEYNKYLNWKTNLIHLWYHICLINMYNILLAEYQQLLNDLLWYLFVNWKTLHTERRCSFGLVCGVYSHKFPQVRQSLGLARAEKKHVGWDGQMKGPGNSVKAVLLSWADLQWSSTHAALFFPL